MALISHDIHSSTKSLMSSMGVLGEEDWSKLTRLQLKNGLLRMRVASLVLGGGPSAATLDVLMPFFSGDSPDCAQSRVQSVEHEISLAGSLRLHIANEDALSTFEVDFRRSRHISTIC